MSVNPNSVMRRLSSVVHHRHSRLWGGRYREARRRAAARGLPLRGGDLPTIKELFSPA